MAEMWTADQAIGDILETEVLPPRIVERGLDLAVTRLQREHRDESRVDRLTRQLADLDRELANLADVVARGGAVAAILDAIGRRDAERRRIATEVAALKRAAAGVVTSSTMRTRLRRFLVDWRTY